MLLQGVHALEEFWHVVLERDLPGEVASRLAHLPVATHQRTDRSGSGLIRRHAIALQIQRHANGLGLRLHVAGEALEVFVLGHEKATGQADHRAVIGDHLADRAGRIDAERLWHDDAAGIVHLQLRHQIAGLLGLERLPGHTHSAHVAFPQAVHHRHHLGGVDPLLIGKGRTDHRDAPCACAPQPRARCPDDASNAALDSSQPDMRDRTQHVDGVRHRAGKQGRDVVFHEDVGTDLQARAAQELGPALGSRQRHVQLDLAAHGLSRGLVVHRARGIDRAGLVQPCLDIGGGAGVEHHRVTQGGEGAGDLGFAVDRAFECARRQGLVRDRLLQVAGVVAGERTLAPLVSLVHHGPGHLTGALDFGRAHHLAGLRLQKQLQHVRGRNLVRLRHNVAERHRGVARQVVGTGFRKCRVQAQDVVRPLNAVEVNRNIRVAARLAGRVLAVHQRAVHRDHLVGRRIAEDQQAVLLLHDRIGVDARGRCCVGPGTQDGLEDLRRPAGHLHAVLGGHPLGDAPALNRRTFDARLRDGGPWRRVDVDRRDVLLVKSHYHHPLSLPPPRRPPQLRARRISE